MSSSFVAEDEFSCGICMDVCEDAMLSSCCSQLFCSNCVNSLPKKHECVMCRAQCRYVESTFARRMIASRQHTCTGCSQSINHTAWNNHRYHCGASLFECHVDGCGTVLVRGEMLTHLQDAHGESLLRQFCSLCEDGDADRASAGGPNGTIAVSNANICERKLGNVGGGHSSVTPASEPSAASSSSVHAAAVARAVNPVSFEQGCSARSLVLLGDGRVCSGSDDGTMKIWNMSSGVCERTLTGHEGCVFALVFLGDGRVCSGSRDGTMKIWNISSGVCERTLTGHGGSVYALVLLGDGRVCSGSGDDTIKIWNVSSGVCERTLTGHEGCVTALVFLGDGRVCSGSEDDTIKIWNISSGVCERTLTGHEGCVTALVLLGDGRVFSGSEDGTIKIWNMSSGVCERTLTGHEDLVNALVLLGDGRVCSGCEDGTIKIWNISSGVCERTLTGHEGCVFALVLLDDGRVCSGSGDDTIKIWSV